MISTTVGVFTFLTLLLLAVQVAYGLYATTMVTAAANDAARRLAGSASADDAEATARAEGWVRELLGAYGTDNLEEVAATRGPETVTLRVVATNPSFLPPAVRRPLGLDRIERTVRIRVEREVP